MSHFRFLLLLATFLSSIGSHKVLAKPPAELAIANKELAKALNELDKQYEEKRRAVYETHVNKLKQLRKKALEGGKLDDAQTILSKEKQCTEKAKKYSRIEYVMTHFWDGKRQLPRVLFANGKINNPEGPGFWELENGKLQMMWKNSKAPNGIWVDTFERNKSGELVGSNNAGAEFTGELIYGDF